MFVGLILGSVIHRRLFTAILELGWSTVIGQMIRTAGRSVLLLRFKPVHVEPCDLDDNGLVDLVVADIGEFNAEDSQLGQCVWLLGEA